MKQLRKLHNLTRIVVGGQRGWQVKINRRGQRHEPYFSDSVYGGKQEALAAAIKARDKIDKAFPVMSRQERAQRITRRTKSGRPGVRLVKAKRGSGKRQRIYEFTVASWCPRPGVAQRRAFSVNKYGRKGAMALALKARAEGVRRMAG